MTVKLTIAKLLNCGHYPETKSKASY